MKNYTHMSSRDRKRLFVFLDQGLSIQAISERLNRHRSTIYRELSRNQDKETERYLPGIADQLRLRRCRHGRPKKIMAGNALYFYLLRKLKSGWSPEQISGRLRLGAKPFYVCHETIYRYIYGGNKKTLYQLLAYKKVNRGRRYGRRKRSCKYKMLTSIHERPSHVLDREELGHWEGDTIAFSNFHHKNVTTLVERKTRFTMLCQNQTRKSQEVMGTIQNVIKLQPKRLWKSLTLDQGSEFAYADMIDRHTPCSTYYCDPRSPWQRGTNENTNGRLRRYLPKAIDICNVSQNDLDNIAKKINNTPRKCLGFMTPKEALFQECKTFCRTSS